MRIILVALLVCVITAAVTAAPTTDASPSHKKGLFDNIGHKIDDLREAWRLFKSLYGDFTDKSKAHKGFLANMEQKIKEINEAKKLFEDVKDLAGKRDAPESPKKIDNIGHKINDLLEAWRMLKSLYGDFTDKSKAHKGFLANMEQRIKEVNEAKKLFEDVKDLVGKRNAPESPKKIENIGHKINELLEALRMLKSLYGDFTDKSKAHKGFLANMEKKIKEVNEGRKLVKDVKDLMGKREMNDDSKAHTDFFTLAEKKELEIVDGLIMQSFPTNNPGELIEPKKQ